MSFASVRTPAPTSGSIQKGAIPAKGFPIMRGGLPTVASLGNPSIHNRVTEIKTNGTAAAPIFVRPWAQQFERDYAEGDLLFVKTEDGAGGRNRTKIHTVANLPVLNYLLRQKENGQLIYDPKNDGVSKFLTEFKFFGVYLNDMDTGSRYQRLLNVTVRGKCRVPDYWNNDGGNIKSSRHIEKGQCLWLALQVVELESGLRTNPDGGKSIGQAETVLQVVPLLVPLDNLSAAIRYRSKLDDRRETIPYLQIGVVHQLPGKVSGKSRQRDALHESEKGKLLERFEIFLRV